MSDFIKTPHNGFATLEEYVVQKAFLLAHEKFGLIGKMLSTMEPVLSPRGKIEIFEDATVTPKAVLVGIPSEWATEAKSPMGAENRLSQALVEAAGRYGLEKSTRLNSGNDFGTGSLGAKLATKRSNAEDASVIKSGSPKV